MKKIVTVSVLAIMAVSAANADIASTKYVDDQLGDATSTLTTAIGKKADTTALEALSGTVSGHTTSIGSLESTVSTKAAAADLTALEGRVGTAEGEIDTLQQDVLNIKGGDLNIGAGTIEESQLTTDLQDKINAAATQEALNGVSTTVGQNTQAISALDVRVTTAEGKISTAEGKIDTLEKAGYQNADQVTSAINTALQPYANNTAGYQNAGQVTSAINTALADYTTTTDMNAELAKKADKTQVATDIASATNDMATNSSVDTKLANYTTTSDLNTELNKKLDDTATGSATLPIFIDTDGVAKTITSYAGKAATAGQADSAADYAAEGGIATKFGSVDSALANVAAFGAVPTVPAECKTGSYNCTLVVEYNAEANALVHTWEKIAR